MRLTRQRLRDIIASEMAYLGEACGCPAAGGEPHLKIMHSVGEDQVEDREDPEDTIGELSREESLDLVAMIAKRTSCPVTGEALMDVVNELRGEEGDHEGQSCEEAHPGNPHDAWARGSQASVPDLSKLDPSDAFGIGHGVGSGEITDYDISG